MSNTRRAEILFYLGFIPLMVVLFWRTTDFPQIERLETLTMLLFAGCVALKMLLFDTWKLWEVILFVICFAVAGLSYYKSTFMRPLVIVIAVYGARGLDGRKILKVWLVLSVINIILTLSAAGFGLIENFKSESSKERLEWFAGKQRNSLGFIHSTDCVARVFFTSLVYFYLRGERLRWFEYLAFFAIAVILYRLTGGRIDCGCIVLADALFGIVNLGKRILEYRGHERSNAASVRRFWGAVSKMFAAGAMLSMPVGAALTLTLSYVYRPGGILLKLNKWMTGRLAIGHDTFTNYDITLFGQFIKMYGFGGGAAYQYIEDAKYNFIDISYQNVLILYGLVFFFLIIGLFIYISWNRRRDIYLMICIIMIAINCMIAHHLTELAYIPFTMLVFAKETNNNNLRRNSLGLTGNQRLQDQPRR